MDLVLRKMVLGKLPSRWGIVLLIVAVEVAALEDYCDTELCKQSEKHIGCGESRDSWNSRCKENKIINLNGNLRNVILNTHNNYRNQVAKGEIDGLASSSSMPVVVWDENLEILARYHGKTCQHEHDQCRNTKKYPYAGQNLALTYTTSSDEPNYEETIKRMIENWWEEKQYVCQALIDDYDSKSGSVYGHFTQLVRDKANRIGCALVRYKKDEFYNTMLTCNYSYGNMKHTRVYKTGNPCSNCPNSCDRTWTGLCATDEQENYDQVVTVNNPNPSTNNPCIQTNSNVRKQPSTQATARTSTTIQNSTNSNGDIIETTVIETHSADGKVVTTTITKTKKKQVDSLKLL